MTFHRYVISLLGSNSFQKNHHKKEKNITSLMTNYNIPQQNFLNTNPSMNYNSVEAVKGKRKGKKKKRVRKESQKEMLEKMG